MTGQSLGPVVVVGAALRGVGVHVVVHGLGALDVGLSDDLALDGGLLARDGPRPRLSLSVVRLQRVPHGGSFRSSSATGHSSLRWAKVIRRLALGGFDPQKICVPTMPMMCTITVLSTIDFAVAVPTPTGPPPAV